MLHSEALSFKGPRTLLLVRPYPSHCSAETLIGNWQCLGQRGRCSSTASTGWQWFHSSAERVYSLETKHDSWNHSTMDHSQTLLLPTQSMRNWEPSLNEVMLDKPILDTKLDKAIGSLVTESALLTVSSDRSSKRNTFLMSRTKTASPQIYATWLIDLSYWIKRDLRDAFLWSFLVTCELAVRFLSFCQLWMELVSVLESYWWETENQGSRIWPLCVCTCNCVCMYTLRNTHKNMFDSSIPY